MNKKNISLLILVFMAACVSNPAANNTSTIPDKTVQPQATNTPVATEVIEPTPTPTTENPTAVPDFLVSEWTKNKITGYFSGLQISDSADLDLDGDIDVVSCSSDGEIAIFLNNPGDEKQWEKRIVGTDFGFGHWIEPVDIDLDGFEDILAISYSTREIAWWKNPGDNSEVWEKENITTQLMFGMTVTGVDADNDGDMDVISTSHSGIIWWRNDGGNPTTWAEIIIVENIPFWPIYAEDIDSDGDIDLAGGSDSAGGVYFIENVINESDSDEDGFILNLVGDTFQRVTGVHVNDINGDGQLDIISSDFELGKISVWYSDGGDPINWTEDILDEDLTSALYVDSFDVENDGDIDIFITDWADNQVVLYLNTGSNLSEWEKVVIGVDLKDPHSLFSVDFDLDGDLDILITVAGDYDILWLENDYSGD